MSAPRALVSTNVVQWAQGGGKSSIYGRSSLTRPCGLGILSAARITELSPRQAPDTLRTPMKIRFAIVAAMIAAATAACSSTPTAVDQRSPRSGSILRDGSPPPPDTTITRGGGAAGSGN